MASVDYLIIFRDIIVFFVHIPKTAGTSFRKAAESYFGSDHVCYDYAPASVETSDLVREEIYQKKDFSAFYKKYSAIDKNFLSGHVHAGKYIGLFGARDTVVFLRDPIQRTISEYKHFCRDLGYEGDFRSFYREPGFIDRQKKMLSAVPLMAFGFVGLTERYEESLRQINDRYDTRIEGMELNRGRKSIGQDYDLEPEVLAELQQLNREDLALYQQAVELFAQRERLWQEGLPFVHGAIQQANPKSLVGWAWWDRSDEPVVVEVLHEGRVLGEASAHDLRPGMLRFGLPRYGYVGFRVVYPRPLPAGAKVICRVKATGQLLGEASVQPAP